MARLPRPHLWPGWGTGTHLPVLCVHPSSTPGSAAEIPSLFGVCDSVTFCVLFQPLKPRSQSRIPSCFRCQCVIDTLVTQRKSWTSHPHAGVLVLFGFLSCRMHIPNSIVGSRQLLCVPPRAETHRGQRPSELPWQDLCHLCCVPGSTPSPRITLLFLGTALPFSGPHSGAEITALLCLAPATLAPTSLEAAATCPQPSSVPVAGLEGAPLSLWGLV